MAIEEYVPKPYESLKSELITSIDGLLSRMVDRTERPSISVNPTDWIDCYRNASGTILMQIDLVLFAGSKIDEEKKQKLDNLKLELKAKFSNLGPQSDISNKLEIDKLLEDLKAKVEQL